MEDPPPTEQATPYDARGSPYYMPRQQEGRDRQGADVGDDGGDLSAAKLLLRDIAAQQWPDAEELERLYDAARAGSEPAARELASLNWRLAVGPAFKQSAISGINFEELMQAAVERMARGYNKYDPQKGAKPSTYVTIWVKKGIREAVSTGGPGSELKGGRCHSLRQN